MKNRIIIGILILILGAVIAIGPQAFLPVCGGGMICVYADEAELSLGAVIAVLGLLLLLLKNEGVRLGLAIAAVLNGIAAFLIPSALIGVCASPDMHCHAFTLPVLLILSGLVVAVSVMNIIYLRKFTKGKKQQ